MINLEEIKQEVQSCQKCSLYKERTYPVVGEGNSSADIMLIGEAPGFNEDKTGHPFCGKAGEILDELLNSVRIKREEIYISNILKCRPPGNRNPQEEEIKSCSPYLDRQIEIIKPKVICCLGNFSTPYILKKFGLKSQIQGISRIHGQIFSSADLFTPLEGHIRQGLLTGFTSIKIIPLYHPAVVTYNMNMKAILIKDFKILEPFKDS